MPAISKIRPILLSAPYANKNENLEVDLHLKSGYRTTGLVEITLDDGTIGYGEAYLAVFAPKVFTSIVELITPYLLGRDILDIPAIVRDLTLITDYWSYQGAARHVTSAFEIALSDCKAKVLGIPVYKLFNQSSTNSPIKLYGSGGDSPYPKYMMSEFDLLNEKGIDKFKIRARSHQVRKALWCIDEGHKRGIDLAIDMTQNLANPGQAMEDVLHFHQMIHSERHTNMFFLEEVLGIAHLKDHPSLRKNMTTKVAGGEIVTTPSELMDRIENGWYDIAQPDATVIGGISDVLKIFKTAENHGIEVLVHCWGGPVGMMANYHAAIAGGGTLAEWPMPNYPLRDALVEHPWKIRNGQLILPDTPGLGIRLTEELERKYKFREEAVYSCLVDTSGVPSDDHWIA